MILAAWKRSRGAAFAALIVTGGAAAQDAYVPNQGSDDLTIFDIHDPTDKVTGTVGQEPHESVASLDAKYVFVSSRVDDSVSVFDTRTRQEIDTDGNPGNGTTPIAVGDQPHGLAITRDNRYVFVTNDGSDDVSVIDVSALSVVSTVPAVGNGPHMVAIRPGGKEAWVGNLFGGDVSILDVELAVSDPGNAVICATPGGSGAACRIPSGAGTEGVAFTKDGKVAYVASGAANTVTVIDAEARNGMGVLPVPGSPRRVHVSPDGRRAYVSQLAGNDVAVIDTTTHSLLPGELIAGVSDGLGMDFRADGARLYVSNFFSSIVTVVHLPDSSTREIVGAGTNPDSVSIQPEEIFGVAFDPDKTTMRWSENVMADRYDVYRDDVTALPAAGLCRNGDDPDLTDTTFVDTTVPANGAALFYVVGLTKDGRAGVLGHATSGDLRAPATACP